MPVTLGLAASLPLYFLALYDIRLVCATVGRVGVDISRLVVISVEIGVISNHHS
jgi:hypothetical protein